eukprot:1161598_1
MTSSCNTGFDAAEPTVISPPTNTSSSLSDANPIPLCSTIHPFNATSSITSSTSCLYSSTISSFPVVIFSVSNTSSSLLGNAYLHSMPCHPSHPLHLAYTHPQSHHSQW